ncbi:MAG TPA: hypothetical protein VM533_16075 [Fimbriiglobus sp.]|jgi:hypothetical protein|nr:hypothetical protein [Fimbriiglobus sp.]
MTSFVEYHGFGFWCRNAVLTAWLEELLAVARPRVAGWPWLKKACLYWDAVVCALKSGRLDLALEVDVNSATRQRQCEELFAAVAERDLPPAVQRCAILALALVRGELTGTRARSVELWSGDEWRVG